MAKYRVIETEEGLRKRIGNGRRRWSSEFRKHGSVIAELIPEGLREGVLGDPEVEVDPGVQMMLDKLTAINQAEPEVNPFLLLRKRLGR
jgi:hypothetical protein